MLFPPACVFYLFRSLHCFKRTIFLSPTFPLYRFFVHVCTSGFASFRHHFSVIKSALNIARLCMQMILTPTTTQGDDDDDDDDEEQVMMISTHTGHDLSPLLFSLSVLHKNQCRIHFRFLLFIFCLYSFSMMTLNVLATST